MAIDLHLHTQASDGTWSPAELVRKATHAGLSAIAVTDHDAIASLNQAAQEAVSAGLTFLPGVEISASYNRDIFLHILGYGINPEDPAIKKVLTFNQRAWDQSEYDSIDNLAKIGITINMDRYNHWRTNRHQGGWPLLNTLQEMGAIQGIGDYFNLYFGLGKPAYVEIIFVSPQEAIDAIHQAGGVAVLAHPGLYKEDGRLLLRKQGFLDSLIELGIDGLEAFNSSHDPAIAEEIRSIALEKGLLITGGSDCHGEFAGRCIGNPVVDEAYLPPLLAKIGERKTVNA